jgi:hypothetical protein
MRNFVVIFFTFVSGFFALNVNATKVSPEYLVGLWSMEGKEKCESEGFEYVAFFADGTFKTGKRGRVESVGFWRLYEEDDEFDLHMVTSLGFFGEEYAEFKGRFSYLDLKALPFSITEDEFDGVASFGGDLERFHAARCK